VVDQDNSLSFRNHEGYIANRSGFDNEGSAYEKRGRHAAPLFFPEYLPSYSLAPAPAASGPAAPCASEMRAFLPRNPRR